MSLAHSAENSAVNGTHNLAEFYTQLKNVAPPVAESASLPSVSYSSTEVLEREKQAIFRRSWICIGRSDQWTEAGQYRSRQIVGVLYYP